MPQNPNQVLMGATGSNFKEVSNHAGAEATFEAGVAVRLKSDDTLSLALSDGHLLGISLGRSLSVIDIVSVCRKGLSVPVKLASGFDPAIGAQVFISDTTGLAGASGSGYTGVNAVYVSGRIGGTGVNGGLGEDGVAKGAALIDFPGGL